MRSYRKRLLWLLMGALAVSAGLGLLSLVFTNTFQTGFIGKLLLTLIGLAGCTVGWIACEKVGAQHRMRWIAFIANVLFGLAYVGVIVLIWIPLSQTYTWKFENQVQKITVTAALFGVMLAGGGLLRLIKAQQMRTKIVQRWTIIFGAVLCAVSTSLIWEVYVPEGVVGAVLARVLIALFILTVVGAPAVLVLRRIEIAKLAEVAETGLPALIRIALACPRCDLQQELPSGGSVCKGCGLAITIEVAEPVCAECGYSLAGLIGAECPECGRTIPPEVLRLAGRMRKAP